MASWKKTYIIASLMATVTLLQLITGETSFQKFIISEHITTLLEAVRLDTLCAGVAKRLL